MSLPAIDAFTDWLEARREELCPTALGCIPSLREAFLCGWLCGRDNLLAEDSTWDLEDGFEWGTVPASDGNGEEWTIDSSAGKPVPRELWELCILRDAEDPAPGRTKGKVST